MRSLLYVPTMKAVVASLFRCKRKNARIASFGLVACVCMYVFFGYLAPIPELQLKPCKLEKFDPWDDSLKPYIKDPKPLPCSHRVPLMYMDNRGYIHTNESALTLYRISYLDCCYRAVNREEGDKVVTFGPNVQLKTPAFIQSHVFRVTCKMKNDSVAYDYLHVNSFWNDTHKLESDIENEDKGHLSIIMFGIDSMSRSHALRNLPESYKYILNELKAYDFEGYSKVGENTWPNLVPLFTGESYRGFHLININVKHVDSMPLIWFEPEAEKFVTFFAEDRPDISTFNYVKAGFKEKPTDAYFRPYTLAMHEFEPIIVEPLGNAHWDCFGSGNYFELQLDYLKGFLLRYRQKRKLVYFWNNQAGHEDFTTLSRADAPLLKFLKWLKQENLLKNAILAVFSDHGFRIGGASLTHVGRAENNRPLLLLHVPENVKTMFPWVATNLKTNTQRLVTHYDNYQTVLELLKGSAFSKSDAIPVEKYLVRRNIFNEIPLYRSCVDAGIESKYCTCEERVDTAIDTEFIKQLANALVDNINKILDKNQDVCERLHLHNVTEAKVSFSNSDEDNVAKKEKGTFFNRFIKTKIFDATGRYFITLHTWPGLAYFEGTVDFAEVSPLGEENHVTVVGEPSRLDRYGNQSFCVQDSFLKLYCYCKGFRPAAA